MYKFSKHANDNHCNEKWNARTIRAAYENGNLLNVHISEGKTADVIYGLAYDGKYVGLIVGKNGIIITGFCAPLEYWQNQ